MSNQLYQRASESARSITKDAAGYSAAALYFTGVAIVGIVGAALTYVVVYSVLGVVAAKEAVESLKRRNPERDLEEIVK